MDYDDRNKNVVGKYRLGVVLGTGDFDCTIRTCTHVVTGQQFAIRVYSKVVLAEKGSWQQLADAVQVVRTLPRSERIVETVECFETSSYLYILMAFAQGISLYKLLVLGPGQYKPHRSHHHHHHHHGGGNEISASGNTTNNNNASSHTLSSAIKSTAGGGPSDSELVLDLNHKRIIFMQVLQGLQHLHSHDVAHMSLAPDHILIHWDGGASSQSAAKFSVRIGFLVACKKVDPGQKMRHLCGTNHTIAPEVLRQTEAYDPFLADIWSAGVIWYFMLSGGKYPFDGANTSKHILSHDVRPLDPAIPSEARELVHDMMHPDPSQRLSLSQVLDHAWLNNKSQVMNKNKESLIQNAVTAKRDEMNGKIIVRVMPLILPKKEVAARVIQAVWRLVRYRPSRAGGGGGLGTKAASMRKKKDGEKGQKKGKKSGSGSLDDAWGAAVESGSDDEDDDYDEDEDENDEYDDDDEFEDDDDDDEEGILSKRKRRKSSRRHANATGQTLNNRIKMIRNSQKSTVPPMPTSLIAHDVRCTHCGRVPPTTFQPGKHPFQVTHFHYRGTSGFQDRQELIRQQQAQDEQEMMEHLQHQQEQQQQQLMLMMQQQQDPNNYNQQQQMYQFYNNNNNASGNSRSNSHTNSFILQTPPPFSLSGGNIISQPVSLSGSYRRPTSATNSLAGGTSSSSVGTRFSPVAPGTSPQQQQNNNNNNNRGGAAYHRGRMSSNNPSNTVNSSSRKSSGLISNAQSQLPSFLITPTPPPVPQTQSIGPNNNALFLPQQITTQNNNNNNNHYQGVRRITSELGISGFYENPSQFMSSASKGERAFAGKGTPSSPTSRSGFLSSGSGGSRNNNLSSNNNSLQDPNLTLEQRRAIFQQQQQQQMFYPRGSISMNDNNTGPTPHISQSRNVYNNSTYNYNYEQYQFQSGNSRSSGSGTGTGTNSSKTRNNSDAQTFSSSNSGGHQQQNQSNSNITMVNTPIGSLGSNNTSQNPVLQHHRHPAAQQHPSLNPLPPLARGYSTMSSASGGTNNNNNNNTQQQTTMNYAMPLAIQESNPQFPSYSSNSNLNSQTNLFGVGGNNINSSMMMTTGGRSSSSSRGGHSGGGISGGGGGSSAGYRSGGSSASIGGSSAALINLRSTSGNSIDHSSNSMSGMEMMQQQQSSSSPSFIYNNNNPNQALPPPQFNFSATQNYVPQFSASDYPPGVYPNHHQSQHQQNPQQLMTMHPDHQLGYHQTSLSNSQFGDRSQNTNAPPPNAHSAAETAFSASTVGTQQQPHHQRLNPSNHDDDDDHPFDNVSESFQGDHDESGELGTTIGSSVTKGDDHHRHRHSVAPPQNKRKTLPNIHRADSYSDVQKVDSFVTDGVESSHDGGNKRNSSGSGSSHPDATPTVEPL